MRDGSRRITHITEVMGLEGEVIITQDVFFSTTSLARTRTAICLASIGRPALAVPKFWERARYYGEEQRLAAALDAAEVANVGMRS